MRRAYPASESQAVRSPKTLKAKWLLRAWWVYNQPLVSVYSLAVSARSLRSVPTQTVATDLHPALGMGFQSHSRAETISVSQAEVEEIIECPFGNRGSKKCLCVTITLERRHCKPFLRILPNTGNQSVLGIQRRGGKGKTACLVLTLATISHRLHSAPCLPPKLRLCLQTLCPEETFPFF